MKAMFLVGILLVGGLSLAYAMPREGIAGLFDLTVERLPPPPEIHISSPREGDGVPARVTFAGQARSASGAIIDVQVRVDQSAWRSIPDVPRGLASAPFSVDVAIPPGDHVLEARAWDGEAYSMSAHVLVRRDAPSIRFLGPLEGDALSSGTTLVRGIVTGAADAVLLEADGASLVTPVLPGGFWSASVPLPDGLVTLRATARAAVPSLPALARVAVGSPAPPALSIGSPTQGAAYGETGDLTCGGACILFSGASERAERIATSIDGRPADDARLLTGGAWSLRAPVQRLASGAHRATFTPYDAAGLPGVTRAVEFATRTPASLAVDGSTEARETGTPLHFDASGEGAAEATWTLDGLPLASGPSVRFSLDRPGTHRLAVHATLADGHGATGEVALFAFNRAPQVSLAEPTLSGGALHFEASGSDPDGTIAIYSWEFGDGTRENATTANVAHRYGERGVYVVNLTVVDDLGATASTSTVALVPNVRPIANFSFAPERPSILDVVTLRDTSFDLDGGPLSRIWSFDDGTSSTHATPSVRFRTRGLHNVTLSVTDELGDLVSLTRAIEVIDLAPEASFSWSPAVPRVHEHVSFMDNSTDVDGPLAHHAWDFGAGSTANGSAPVHVFRAPGTYSVTLVVTDDMGLAANVTLPVFVADGVPTVTAVIADPPEPRARDAVRFEVLAADREGSIVALAWDFGDNTTSTEAQPLHRYARSGRYAGSVIAYDEAGLSTRFPFTLVVGNAPPSGTVALVGGGYAAFPTLLQVNATDPDGRIALYRVDANGDGIIDCDSTEPVCSYTYAEPGVYPVHAWIEDDEASRVALDVVVDIGAPPSHLAPPTVTIVSPSRDAQMRGDHLVRGSAVGVRPIERVEIQFRNGTWAYSGTSDAWRLANPGLSWSALIDTRSFVDGDYDIVVRATDAGGGIGFARLPVHIENGPRLSEVTLHVLAPAEVPDSVVAIRGSAFHPQGVTSVRWRVDEGSWRFIAESPLAFTIPLDARGLAPGEHTLAVEAYHGATQRTAQAHVFRVPGAAPTLILDEPPGRYAHGLLVAGGRVLGEGYAEWRLDHGLWQPLPAGPSWSLRQETIDIAGGRHTLDLRAVSPDGRLASPVQSFPIDVLNPPFDTEPARRGPPPLIPLGVPLSPWLAVAAVGLGAMLLRRRE